jgi:hypothetical protein
LDLTLKSKVSHCQAQVRFGCTAMHTVHLQGKKAHASRPFPVVLTSDSFVWAGGMPNLVGMYRETPPFGCGTCYKNKCMHVPMRKFVKKEAHASRPFPVVLISDFFVWAGGMPNFVGMYRETRPFWLRDVLQKEMHACPNAEICQERSPCILTVSRGIDLGFFVWAGGMPNFVGMYRETPPFGCGTCYKKKCMHVRDSLAPVALLNAFCISTPRPDAYFCLPSISSLF